MPDKDANTVRLSGIIDSILKPLRFASKDNFAHLKTVKGLEPLMTNLSREASLNGLDEGLRFSFKELESLFSGFDGCHDEIKKEKINRALDMLNSFAPDEEETQAEELKPDDAIRMINRLKTPLEIIKGVGPKLAERLKAKGLATVEDALYFLPIRYEDRTRIKKVRELTPGSNEVTAGTVLAMGEARYGRRKVFEMAVGDGSGLLKVKWFHYRPPYMKRFKVSQKLILFGAVSVYGKQLEMVHPDIEILGDDEPPEKDFGGIVPVYSQIENFHQKTVRKIIRNIVESFADSSADGVPAEVRRRLGLMDVGRAFKEAHLPASLEAAGGKAQNKVQLAKKSLVFDELFLLELGLAIKRAQTKKEGGIEFLSGERAGDLEGKLRSLLPFTLTRAQERVLDEIGKDMSSPHPMNRLIQGDVGSGKTIVSFISALRAIGDGYQAAIMAPTEILAEQHYLSTRRYAEALGIRTMLLTGSAPKAERRVVLEAIRAGEADLIIGTHALIQKDVEFSRLGLIIIDEQHRFGVVQRSILRKKGLGYLPGKEVFPDMLIMTATPIPRTLSMTVFGDLDVSIIDELPPGRTPVHTRIIREKDRLKAYDFIKKELASKSQCYIVYPLVEESEELSLKDATNMKEHLASDVFTEFNVGLLHGRMKAVEKESVMRDFKERKIDILVSTTVIEVGVDVPNATVMLIEHAERFGLAQLHQLRGRVGRGERRSTCLLMAAWTNSEDTYRRLKVMEETMDGFKIAEEDLLLRGPGDFLGTRQAGLPDFRTDALSDLTILRQAREEAMRFMEKNPGLSGNEARSIREILKERWTGRLELAEIG